MNKAEILLVASLQRQRVQQGKRYDAATGRVAFRKLHLHEALDQSLRLVFSLPRTQSKELFFTVSMHGEVKGARMVLKAPGKKYTQRHTYFSIGVYSRLADMWDLYDDLKESGHFIEAKDE